MNMRRWISAATTLLLSLFLSVTLARAQDHDDRDHHDQDNRGYQGDHDRGNHNGDRHDHDRFDDRDRQVSREWYQHHRGAFRDREGRYWHNDWEPEIREGFVFTPDMRRAIRPVPRDLYGRLEPPPPGYRYVMIGDHICLVDRDYRIHDVLHFELNF
jgi:hypothetical protein